MAVNPPMSRIALAAACAALIVGVNPRSARGTRAAAGAVLKMSRDAEAKGLRTVKGITTAGAAVPRLFPVRSERFCLAGRVRKAARASSPRSPRTARPDVFRSTSPEWRKWMNQDYYVRQGVASADMTAAQRDVALTLLRASL